MNNFWDKVDKSGECWLWTAAKDDAGYGQFRFHGKNTKAHRVSYYLAYGYYPRITRHTCDNPSCVKPEHLIDGTQKDNVKDMLDRNRHCGSITNEQAVEIRKMIYDETIISRVVDRYNINADTARRILNGETFKHIEPKGRPIPRQRSRRKLKDFEVQEILEELSSPYWGQQTILAKKYGVSRNVIQRIQYGTY